MRIVFLEERPDFGGGSERMSLALCRHAIQRGHSAWLVHAAPGTMVEAYQQAGASCRQLPVFPIAVRRPFVAARGVLALIDLVREAGANVLFTSQVSFASILAAVGRWTGSLSAMHLGLAYEFPSPVFWAGARSLGLAVAPSEHTADAWRKSGWPERSLRIIPNGVDIAIFSPGDRQAARARHALPMGAPIVAYVGRLVPEKGLTTLMRAFARHRRAGGDGTLIFVGSAPAEGGHGLAEVAESEGLSDDAWQVRPPTPAPEDIYRAADLVVVPSEWDEPFGLVPLEAAACGTLTIVSDRGLLPTLVESLGRDTVFRSADVDSLSERLSFWLADRPRREHAARVVSEDVRRRYSFEACGDAYLSAFAAGTGQ